MSLTFHQSNATVSNTTGSSFTLQYASNVTTGNLLIVWASSPIASPSISDDKSNTWTQVAQGNNLAFGWYSTMWYAIANAGSGGTRPTITIGMGGSDSNAYDKYVTLAEYTVSGVAPTVDGTGNNTNGAAGTYTITTSAATGSSDLVVGGAGGWDYSGYGNNYSQPISGYTIESHAGENGYACVFFDKTASGSGTQTVSLTTSKNFGFGVLANFQQVVSAASLMAVLGAG